MFLSKATFGPTEGDVDRVMSIGYSAWIDEQFATPATSHRASWEAADAAIKAADPMSGAGQDPVFHSFWKQAVSGNDQLRQRVAYALSQIIVISMADGTVGDNPRAVAAWLDMLGDKGLTNYRELIEAVSLHPMMGVYLSHLRNQKADARTGRVPDENYAREVMQLFSIGLVELNSDGSVKTNAGRPIETYGPSDIAGLAARVHRLQLGLSGGAGQQLLLQRLVEQRVGSRPRVQVDDRLRAVPQHRGQDASSARRSRRRPRPIPQASLAAALDALHRHPNVGPFIGKQLIQRLVTSNPSPAYVRAVAGSLRRQRRRRARRHEGGGQGGAAAPRGARQRSTTAGKVREPVLRLSALPARLRLHAPTPASTASATPTTRRPRWARRRCARRRVFNFYRPGYVPPGTPRPRSAWWHPRCRSRTRPAPRATSNVHARRDQQRRRRQRHQRQRQQPARPAARLRRRDRPRRPDRARWSHRISSQADVRPDAGCA